MGIGKSLLVAGIIASSGHIALADDIKFGRPAKVLLYGITDRLDKSIAAMLIPLRQKTADHLTLTREDVTRVLQRDRAARKGRLMSGFFFSDTNGDNVLDADELASPFLNEELRQKDIVAADTDHDGKVSLPEALVYSTNLVTAEPTHQEVVPLDELLALDPNGDGRLTQEEVVSLVTAAFAYYDKDGDGTLSAAERATLLMDRAALSADELFHETMSKCAMPTAGSREKVYLITVHDGGTLSNVAVGGQNGVTGIATIDIAAGDEPLYIAAMSYEPTIWRFTGHAERVAHFFATAGYGSGAVGLPREKVTLKHDSECIRSFVRPSISSAAYYDRLASALNHKIEGLVLRRSAFTINLPADARQLTENSETNYEGDKNFTLSGMPVPSGAEAFPDALKSLQESSPGGVVPLDPSSVVGSGAVERYLVLPRLAGLLQLLEDGSLEMRGGQFFARKPFARYPAGLAGAYSVRFVFPEGMKLPDGSKATSDVRIFPTVDSLKP